MILINGKLIPILLIIAKINAKVKITKLILITRVLIVSEAW